MTANQIFEQTHTILTHEADAFGLWRADAAFRLMQEMAGEHSMLLGVSRDDLLSTRNCIWMLARVQLQMHAWPHLHDTLHAHTWYGEPGKITYPRYVRIADGAGSPVADLATSWIVVDMDSRRILPPGKAQLPFPPAAALEPPMPEPARMRMERPGEPRLFSHTPLYSDLDVNGHVNNANYATWILDLFPLAHHESHRIRSMYISYSAEAVPGEEVQLALYQNGLSFEVLGTDKQDGHTVFEANGVWSE